MKYADTYALISRKNYDLSQKHLSDKCVTDQMSRSDTDESNIDKNKCVSNVNTSSQTESASDSNTISDSMSKCIVSWNDVTGDMHLDGDIIKGTHSTVEEDMESNVKDNYKRKYLGGDIHQSMEVKCKKQKVKSNQKVCKKIKWESL